MIIACYSVWNDIELLKKSVDSLCDQVDFIIVVDGAYTNFPHDIPWSTDKTREFVESLENATFIGNSKPWYHQFEKRNEYLIGEEGDFYFIIDADEVLEGGLRTPQADVGIFECKRQSDNAVYHRARLIKHVDGIHYSKKHYWLCDGEGNTVALLAKAGKKYREERMPGRILHINHERDFQRESAQRQYYQIHGNRERSIPEWT